MLQSRHLIIKATAFFLLAIGVVASFLFLTAGSFGYRQGWVYMGVLFVPCIFVLSYLLRNDPALLKRRLQFTEKIPHERIIIRLAQIVFFLGFVIPGFDRRFGRSHVPIRLIISSDIIIFLSYMLVFRVFRVNTFASRIVDHEHDQTVVTDGPYAFVRHPMYTGQIFMYIFTPLALGSYIALPVFVAIISVIIFRIIDEERLLIHKLDGYKTYIGKVRYRLMPGLR